MNLQPIYGGGSGDMTVRVLNPNWKEGDPIDQKFLSARGEIDDNGNIVQAQFEAHPWGYDKSKDGIKSIAVPDYTLGNIPTSNRAELFYQITEAVGSGTTHNFGVDIAGDPQRGGTVYMIDVSKYTEIMLYIRNDHSAAIRIGDMRASIFNWSEGFTSAYTNNPGREILFEGAQNEIEIAAGVGHYLPVHELTAWKKCFRGLSFRLSFPTHSGTDAPVFCALVGR